MRTLLLLSAVISLSTACKNSSDNQAEPPPKTVAAANLEWKKLGDLGIEAEVPSDARVEDNTASAGFPSVTIYASPSTFVSGAGDMSDLKPTLEETKAQLAKDPNKLKSWTKSETILGGWILEGTRESLTGNTLYAVSVRRSLRDKPYDCGANAQSEAERDAVKKICRSLRLTK
jgi:hypothetical protein